MNGTTAAPARDAWFLRAPDGHVYGPVEFDKLRVWAAQNRFTAGYRISGDQQAWRTVESVPELGMDWFVESAGGGRYGPFHPLALLDYVREGAIPPDAPVIHKSNGGTAKAHQVLLEAFVDAIDQTAEEQGRLLGQIELLQEQLAERERRLDAETQRAEAALAEVRELADRFTTFQEQSARKAERAAELAAAETARWRGEWEAERERRREAEQKIADGEERARSGSAVAEERDRQAARERTERDQEHERQRREWASRVQALTEASAQAQEAAESRGREAAALRREKEEWTARWENVRQEQEAAVRAQEERDALARENAALTVRLAAAAQELEGVKREAELAGERAARTAGEAVERVNALNVELQTARARLRDFERPAPAEAGRPADAGPGWIDVNAEERGGGPAAAEPGAPPRKTPSLIGLEARAQAELRAWQERKRNGGPRDADAPPKVKSWIPWKKP